VKAKLKRLDTPWGRAYVLGEGKEAKFLPSVTTVLSLVSSTYLQDLEEKIGKEERQSFKVNLLILLIITRRDNIYNMSSSR
jgi:hypothetical protein